ncbi:MAG TPA: hypothetical protein VLM89_00525 [Phycisphaerae bacterium]|nr:hypothetical protein [Phycisphaerae bacterium]
MTRLIKFIALTGLSSVLLAQGFCTYDHGISIIPKWIIPNPFAGLLNSLTSGLLT